MRSLGRSGKIIDYTRDCEEVQVQVGVMRINAHIEDLEKINYVPESSIQGEGSIAALTVDKNLGISSQIDLRGLTLDEAIERVDKYLDDAFLAGLEQVTIIHGKGTGKLRRGLQEYLKEHRQVKDYRLGVPNEGGTGVTVVKIKGK